MADAPDLDLVLDVARAPADVRAWWLEFADDYRATDPREQPHRIQVLARRPDGMDLLTHWRLPVRDIVIPETFHVRPDGWSVDVGLPFGLAQRDEFRLEETPTGTRVRIQVWVRAKNAGGRLARAFFLRYAKRSYPRTWRAAAQICARDAPHVSPAGPRAG